jgi:hypothetical protein
MRLWAGFDQNEQVLGAVSARNAKQAEEARNASMPLPRRSRRISGEGIEAPSFMPLLSGISPFRIRPALRKSDDAVCDEELGFMDLDNDPDILETISEKIPCQAGRSVKKEDPKVFLTVFKVVGVCETVSSCLCGAGLWASYGS